MSSSSSSSSPGAAGSKPRVAGSNPRPGDSNPGGAEEWVEIVEPRTGDHMFANLTTGECVWDVPRGAPVRRTSLRQWWELFDQRTSRFYYYNAATQKTVWQRPQDPNCDIIPLAKLQTLKQNTEVKNPGGASSIPQKSELTQTAEVLLDRIPRSTAELRISRNTQSQTSPVQSPRSFRRRRHHHHHHSQNSQGASGATSLDLPRSPTSEEEKLLLRSTSCRAQQNFAGDPSADRIRATIGPAQAKYYSIPHRQKPPIYASPKSMQNGSSNPNSIARSVSFMSKRSSEGDRTKSSDSGGRRSVESTPPAGRRGDKDGVTSPIEGFCTPMVNRKQRQSSQQMSISELVDSGLSTLTDGVKNIPPKPLKLRPRVAQSNGNKMSPLQQYILEQAKLSGYRFGDQVRDIDRDSYVESEDDWRHDDSDDFADDEEDGAASDALSKASSVDGDDAGSTKGRYLSEPTYNNLDPIWLQSSNSSVPPPLPSHPPPPQTPSSLSQADVDAFSEEFDLRMRFSHRGNGTSTMPRPASHQPTTSTSPHQQTSSHYHPPQQHHHFQNHYQQNSSFPVPYEILHPSLQRNTHSLIETSSTLKSRRPPNSTGGGHGGSTLSVSASLQSTISCESDIERYAQDNLNIQKKGLFRKKLTVRDILSHTKEPIKKPLTCLTDKAAKKEALEVFRLVQIYMGDRRAKQGMSINSVALDITTKGYSNMVLRDEIYVQLCKQTTDNSNSRESLRRGWELLALCLSFFPPSTSFAPALSSYIQKHRDPSLDYYPDVGKWPIHVQISHYAGVCSKRLDRIGEFGRLDPKKPSVEEIDQSRLQIFRPSMFGGTLSEAMEIQQDRFPQRRLPWILTTLAEQLLQLQGTSTEGIFRVPADLDEVNSLKSRFDQWEVPACADCHTAASLLKLWLRELYEPLIPDELYEESARIGSEDGKLSDNEAVEAIESVVQRLPELNRDVLTFIIRFLQIFTRPSVVKVTKMDAANLGTVFAPNCLRCPSKDPSVILDNTRKEMAFIKILIVHLDTSAMEGVL